MYYQTQKIESNKDHLKNLIIDILKEKKIISLQENEIIRAFEDEPLKANLIKITENLIFSGELLLREVLN